MSQRCLLSDCSLWGDNARHDSSLTFTKMNLSLSLILDWQFGLLGHAFSPPFLLLVFSKAAPMAPPVLAVREQLGQLWSAGKEPPRAPWKPVVQGDAQEPSSPFPARHHQARSTLGSVCYYHVVPLLRHDSALFPCHLDRSGTAMKSKEDTHSTYKPSATK